MSPAFSPKQIIFVPGFMCDRRLFTQQTKALSAHGFDCTTVDISNISTIEDGATTILKQMKMTPAGIVGLSMGGIIALEMMRQAPEFVSHLALLNTTPFEDRSAEQRREHMARVSKGELLDIVRDELKPTYLFPSNASPEILDIVTQMAQDLGEQSFKRQSVALMSRISYLKSLNEIRCPTLVLTGENDEICPRKRID